MKVIKTIKPGQAGSLKLQSEWGDKLVAIRYRQKGEHIFTTAEIIVDERKYQRGVQQQAVLAQKRMRPVAVRIDYSELELRKKLKERGARWSNHLKLWLVRYEHVCTLAIQNRVIEGAAERCADIDISLM